MSSPLHVLPVRHGSAAENMAVDFLLLQRYPDSGYARFRHYGWHRPSFTFGFSQKIAWVRSQVAPFLPCDLCRRPTGGGVVDHRDDWTYCLVIPRGHPLEECRAPDSYRAVHAALAEGLSAQGVPAVLKRPDPSAPTLPPGLCYSQAEVHDVIRADTGEKIAGAAQKRNKHGMLFQGYVSRSAAGASVDWERFHSDFTARLAATLGSEALDVGFPEFGEGELESLIEQYASEDWLCYR